MDALDDSLQAECSSGREKEHNDEAHPFERSTDASHRRGAPGSGDGGGSGSFDCNICLEIAQDPVVTLCGHLFCWPCLYRWLEVHSISKECPVCKAIVVEDTVIPLYGRGKIGSADPRTKPIPGMMNIPRRPAGQRSANIRQLESQSQPHGLSFTDGLSNHSTAGSFGNLTFSTGFGLFPSLFGLQLHGFHDNGTFSGGSGPAYGSSTGLQGHNIYPSYSGRSNQQQEAFLHKMFLFLLCFVIVCLFFF